MTGGTIGGLVALVVGLLFAAGCIAWPFVRKDYYYRLPAGAWIATGVGLGLLVIGFWWWGMAFTLSSDYHAWNAKEGTVDRVAKRLIATENGMSERYVVTMSGQPYAIDDTRATLIEKGDRISLRCKKEYQWGVPREAHGWACRWNGMPAS